MERPARAAFESEDSATDFSKGGTIAKSTADSVVPWQYIWVVVKIRVPFWVPYIRCRIILGTQKGTLILTTTHLQLRRALTRASIPVFSNRSWQNSTQNAEHDAKKHPSNLSLPTLDR